jgi:hypothetical protein
MYRTLLVALLASAGVVAAPVPKDDDASRMARAYGVVVDPDKDCKFELNGDALRITVPGTPHTLNHHDRRRLKLETLNAPRTWKEVTGDFTATVRVSFKLRADERFLIESGGAKRLPSSGAGLVVWDTTLNYTVFSRDECSAEGKVTGEYLCYRVGPKGTGATHTRLTPGDSAYLRVTRKGQSSESEYSEDGKKWERLDAVEVMWGEMVKVGVFAHTESKHGFSVVLDEYTLAVPKK